MNINEYVKTLKIDETKLKRIFKSTLNFIPEAPQEFGITQTMYWYKLCQLLLDNRRLSHIKSIYIKSFIKNLMRVNNDNLEGVDRQIAGKFLLAEANMMGLKISQIMAAGIPVLSKIEPLDRGNDADHQTRNNNDGSGGV